MHTITRLRRDFCVRGSTLRTRCHGSSFVRALPKLPWTSDVDDSKCAVRWFESRRVELVYRVLHLGLLNGAPENRQSHPFDAFPFASFEAELQLLFVAFAHIDRNRRQPSSSLPLHGLRARVLVSSDAFLDVLVRRVSFRHD